MKQLRFSPLSLSLVKNKIGHNFYAEHFWYLFFSVCKASDMARLLSGRSYSVNIINQWTCWAIKFCVLLLEKKKVLHWQSVTYICCHQCDERHAHFILSIQIFRGENPTHVILLKKTLTLACIQKFTNQFSFKLGLLIKTTKPYILISVWKSLTFIQGHSCMKNKKNFGIHFLPN